MNVSGDYDRRVGFVDHVWRGERLWVARGTLGKVIAPTSFITARNSHDESTESTRGHKNRSDDGCCDAKALRSAVIRARVSQSTISRRGGGGMRWKTFLHRISTRHDESFKRFQLAVAGLKEAVRFPHGKTHNNNMHNRKSTFRYRFFPSTLILLPSPSLPSCPIYDASLAFRSSRLHVNRADSMCGAIEER